MPRDPYLHSNSADAAIQSEIERLKREVSLLEQRSSFTVQQRASSSIDDPVEGEFIIDYSTHMIKWYSNGAWHQCVCGEAVTTYRDIVFTGYPNSETWLQDIYSIPATGGPLFKITDNVGDPYIDTYDYQSVWWISDTEIMVEGDQSGPTPDRFFKFNSDGTGKTLVLESNGFVSYRQYGSDRLMFFIERIMSDTRWRLKSINIDTLVETIHFNSDTQAPAGYEFENAIGIQPDHVGNRIAMFFSSTIGNRHSCRVVDFDGNNMTGELLYNDGSLNDHTGRVVAPFAPLTNTELSFEADGVASLPAVGLGAINVDSQVIREVYGFDEGDQNWGWQAFSNDGTKVALFASPDGGTTLQILIISWDGSGLLQRVTIPFTLPGQRGGLSWSDDDLKIVAGTYGNPPDNRLFIVGVEDGSIEAIYNNDDPDVVYIFGPTWTIGGGAYA